MTGTGSPDRRELLRRLAAGAATGAAIPLIVSARAFALGSGPQPPLATGPVTATSSGPTLTFPGHTSSCPAGSTLTMRYRFRFLTMSHPSDMSLRGAGGVLLANSTSWGPWQSYTSGASFSATLANATGGSPPQNAAGTFEYVMQAICTNTTTGAVGYTCVLVTTFGVKRNGNSNNYNQNDVSGTAVNDTANCPAP